MLIALIGPAAAGKTTIQTYLTTQSDFTSVHLCTSPRSVGLVPSGPPPSFPYETTHLTNHRSLLFADARSLLEYATANWRHDLVTLDLDHTEPEWEGFAKRPFFLAVAVEAPVSVRWRRWCAKYASHQEAAAEGLQAFVEQDDRQLYGYDEKAGEGPGSDVAQRSHPKVRLPRSDSDGPGISSFAAMVQSITALSSDKPPPVPTSATTTTTPAYPPNATDPPPATPTLSALLSSAHLRIHNPFPTLPAFTAHLSALHLSSPHRLRPSWDTYFLSLCTLASLRSNCMKRRVGAVLVRANRVLSTGYNGTPRGLTNCNQGGCPRCNASAPCGTQLDECLCLHAEENTLLEAGRDRGGAEGTVIYCNTCPCLRCAVKIVQCGVREVVYQLEYSMDERSRRIFQEAGVTFRRYIPPS